MLKITWRPAWRPTRYAPKRNSDDLDWDPHAGRTGFVSGTRRIEEPNPFSQTSRMLLSSGYLSRVDMVSDLFSDHDSLMDAIINAELVLDNVLVTWTHFSPPAGLKKAYWAVIRGKRRVTPKENWIVESSLPFEFDNF